MDKPHNSNDDLDGWIETEEVDSESSKTSSLESPETKTLVRFLGFEFSAPANMKNPGLIVISLILANFFLLFFLKRQF